MNSRLARADRGAVRPDLLPTGFQRQAPADSVSHLVRWWWVSQWSLPPGQSSNQLILAYPASNLVVEPQGTCLSGPTTKSGAKTLAGTGWAVGALLRPAAVPTFSPRPADTRDTTINLRLPDLTSAVNDGFDQLDNTKAISSFTDWLLTHIPETEEDAFRANSCMNLVESNPNITSVEQWAQSAHISTRTLHRMTNTYVGLTPNEIIRRRRLQDATYLLRQHPSLTIGEIASTTGFADHSHLVREFRRAFGVTPADYRRSLPAT